MGLIQNEIFIILNERLEESLRTLILESIATKVSTWILYTFIELILYSPPRILKLFF